MKAIVLSAATGPANLKFQNIATPEPGPGQVRVRLHASALNRRDFWITKGMYPDIKLPAILGSDGAGIVDGVGEGVDNSHTGEQVVIYPVYGWGNDPRIPGPDFRILGMPEPGTFAESVCVPLANIYPKPGHLDWGETAAISLAGLTAWRALVTKARIRPGEKLLVTGIGGGVATLILLWAIGLGAEVYVTSGNEEKLQRAQALGAAGGVNYKRDGWGGALRDLCAGVDVVIDGNSGPLFQPCFDALNPAGRYIVYGYTQGVPGKGVDMARLFFRQLRIEGTTMGTPDEYAAMLNFVCEHRIKPVIDKVFDLEHAAAAHEYIGSGSQMGKVVLRHL